MTIVWINIHTIKMWAGEQPILISILFLVLFIIFNFRFWFLHLQLLSFFFFFLPQIQTSFISVCGGVSSVPPVLSHFRSIKRRRTHAGCLKSPLTLPYGWWTGRCSNHTALSRQEEHASHLLLYPRLWFHLQPWSGQFERCMIIFILFHVYLKNCVTIYGPKAREVSVSFYCTTAVVPAMLMVWPLPSWVAAMKLWLFSVSPFPYSSASNCSAALVSSDELQLTSKNQASILLL